MLNLLIILIILSVVAGVDMELKTDDEDENALRKCLYILMLSQH